MRNYSFDQNFFNRFGELAAIAKKHLITPTEVAQIAPRLLARAIAAGRLTRLPGAGKWQRSYNPWQAPRACQSPLIA